MDFGKDRHMSYKWIGAVLIVMACGGFGMRIAAAHRREEASLRQLISALDLMECELQYHLTPLPDLCRQAGEESRGCIKPVLTALAAELEAQIAPDVASCMQAALARSGDIPIKTRGLLLLLGRSLGRFDLPGQLKGMEAVRSECRRVLSELTSNKEVRLRSYQTLGFCTGAALAILFI